MLALADCGCIGALHGTQALTKRFLNVTGGCTVFTGNYSKGAAQAVLPYLLGSRWTESGADAATMKSSAMVILWGANVLDTRLGSEMPRRLLEAKRRGVPIIAIDPRRTATVRQAATWWIPCLWAPMQPSCSRCSTFSLVSISSIVPVSENSPPV